MILSTMICDDLVRPFSGVGSTGIRKRGVSVIVWAYILFMRNGMLNIGMTHNVSKRLLRHSNGTGSRQAGRLKEFALVYVEGPANPAEATKRERPLKKWSLAKKIALIRGDIELLKSLSKSHDP